jgi:PD-(D/E)XK nuclease superfamily protein
MKLHSKQLGAIGVLRVAAHLMSEGLSVFAEMGDLSRVDLIVLCENRPIKIQVKTRNLHDGKVTVDSRKSGPGYMYRYTPDEVDVFAVYIPQRDLVLFLSVAQVLRAKGTTVIRVDQPKNNQDKGIHWFNDYLDFKRALRDHTQSTRTGHAEGKEMIQTTTSANSASES